jgi:fermentation-respiration switch protein FrsA (DUF1100 family)
VKPIVPLSLLAAFAACSSSNASSSPPLQGEDSGAPGEAGPQYASSPAFEILDLAHPSGPFGVSEVLAGDPIDVRVTGLSPSATVTVRAEAYGGHSSATFTVGASGVLDLATDAPTSGTYSGADEDGLVWSIVVPETATVTSDDIGLEAIAAGTTLASTTLGRFEYAPGLTQVNVTENGLVGMFFAPPGAPRHGAIITFGGSEGGLSTGEFYAAYFASLGYPSLGLAYFGAPGLPATLTSVPLEYFEKAKDWLVARPEVDPAHIVVDGASRGGELALLLGATFPWITGVVGEVPSSVPWGGEIPGTSSWTLGGKPVPFINCNPATNTVTLSDGTTGYSQTAGFAACLTMVGPAAVAAASTQVEKTSGPIFLFGGAADDVWPSCQFVQMAVQRLTSAGHVTKYGDESQCYPDAGHGVAFGAGYPTTDLLRTLDPSFGGWLALGGTPQGIAHGQRDVETRRRAFFAANL